MERTKRMPVVGLGTRFLARLGSVGLSLPILGLWTAVAVMPLLIKDEYLLRLAVSSLYFGIQAVAFDFTTGFIGVVNFGFAGFVGLGGYTSALLAVKLGVSPWLGLIAGGVAGGILGFLVGALTLRLSGIFVACMAWFVQLVLMALVTVNVDLTRGELGLIVPYFMSTSSTRPFFYTLLPLAVGIYIILSIIINSNFGLAFRALGQDLGAARASGIEPTRYKLFNWTIASAFAGLLGAFYAHFIGILTPDIMHFKHTVEVLALSYIGGRGTLWGGLISAFLIVPVFEYLKPLMEIRLIIYGLLFVVVMMFYPPGFAGILQRVGELIRRRRSTGGQ
jgi:branched-chain amino acid transport system permease protein